MSINFNNFDYSKFYYPASFSSFNTNTIPQFNMQTKQSNLMTEYSRMSECVEKTSGKTDSKPSILGWLANALKPAQEK